MLTPIENRTEKLKAAGVFPEFLYAQDHPDEFSELQYEWEFPKAAYFYLPQISGENSYLAGWNITPVFDNSNGDIYHVHMERDGLEKFARLYLEISEIGKDFGADFRYLLADFLIDLYESAEFSEQSIDDLGKTGERLGFVNARQLFSALEDATEKKLRGSFEGDREWRETNLPLIINA